MDLVVTSKQSIASTYVEQKLLTGKKALRVDWPHNAIIAGRQNLLACK